MTIDIKELKEKYLNHYTVNWRASDDLIEALPSILETYKPLRILEFGPGFSSLILQQYCKESGASYFGVDDDNLFAWKHRSYVNELGFNENNTHIFKINPDDEWYDYPNFFLQDAPKFDFILIDGPGSDAARASKRARALFERVGDFSKTVWIVDDTHRAESLWLAANWLPKQMHEPAITTIKDRNFARTSMVVVPGQIFLAASYQQELIGQ